MGVNWVDASICVDRSQIELAYNGGSTYIYLYLCVLTEAFFAVYLFYTFSLKTSRNEFVAQVKIKCAGVKNASISIEGSLSKVPLKKENR